jgi:hypothetical protein
MAPHNELDLSPRLKDGKDASRRIRPSGGAIPPAGWNSWNPVGCTPSRRSEPNPPTVRPRWGSATAHDDWYDFPASDDFAGCLA